VQVIFYRRSEAKIAVAEKRTKSFFAYLKIDPGDVQEGLFGDIC
jgi:hypothetical protein